MNKAEKREHKRLKYQLEKIVEEAGQRHANKRVITARLMEDLRKFADDFRAFGN